MGGLEVRGEGKISYSTFLYVSGLQSMLYDTLSIFEPLLS